MTLPDLLEALAELATLLRQTRAELEILRRSHHEVVAAVVAMNDRLAVLEARQDEGATRWLH